MKTSKISPLSLSFMLNTHDNVTPPSPPIPLPNNTLDQNVANSARNSFHSANSSGDPGPLPNDSSADIVAESSRVSSNSDNSPGEYVSIYVLNPESLPNNSSDEIVTESARKRFKPNESRGDALLIFPPLRNAGSKWTKEQDELLIQAVRETPLSFRRKIDWVTISSKYNIGKTNYECEHRWRMINPSKNRAEWTQQEDDKLKEALNSVNRFEAIDWRKLRQLFPDRELSKIKQRSKMINPNFNNGV